MAFAVGAGGSGGPRTGKTIVPCVAKPSRAPDVIVSQKTSIDQAAIYRLDNNVLFLGKVLET